MYLHLLELIFVTITWQYFYEQKKGTVSDVKKSFDYCSSAVYQLKEV